MNTKIGTSFGLALLMAVGVIATMLVLGMFSAKPVGADVGTVTVTPSPTKARSIAQYTILVTSASSQGALNKGDTITVTFNTKTGVPSSMAASAVQIKANGVTAGGAVNQLVNVQAVTISGRAVTLTVPDMDPATGTGDNGIAANAGITITFTQAAGIQNPNLAADTYTLTVKSSADTSAVTSTAYSATSFVSYTPSTAARGATVTVTGGGFAADCTTCHIRFNPQNAVAPTTGNEGSGSIDANGVFAGTFTVDASTNTSDDFVWVVDSAGNGAAASALWVQKAGATPRAVTVSPGSTVSVDLIDFTVAGSNTVIDNNATTGTDISGNAVENSDGAYDLAAGKTTDLTPYKFAVPNGLATGTHIVTVRESNGAAKSAKFSLEVVANILTVNPATAVPGQQITITGTGFDKTSGTIPANSLTAAATGGSTVVLNTADITVSNVGTFNFTTTLPTAQAFAEVSSNAIKIAATDNNGVKGSTTSSGFSRTPRTLVLSPATASPGQSVTVSVTGMTADNNESGNTLTATFTVTGLTFPANATFPVGSDGSGSGTVTIPIGTAPATILLTATDNANLLNADGNANRTATANVKIPVGMVSVDPVSASTGNVVTVSGNSFPPNSTGTALKFGTANGIPQGGFTTDANGDFSVLVEVPAANNGGSLTPGSMIVSVTIGQITGDTAVFSIPSPTITITPSTGEVEDIIVITGTGFNSLVTATKLEIGSASAMPSPAPRVGRNGEITASVLVPLLNPGTYVVVLETGSGFSATGTFVAVASGTGAASTANNTEDVFADVISNGDNLVRVWRYSNSTQSWSFFDPRPEFAGANTLLKTGAGDIVWVNVNNQQDFAHAQGTALVPGWNLIVLK